MILRLPFMALQFALRIIAARATCNVTVPPGRSVPYRGMPGALLAPPTSQRRFLVLDLVAIGATLCFFAVALIYVAACDRL